MPAELRVLMERYCQLGELLPSHEDFDVSDPGARIEAEMILAEMKKVMARIDTFRAKPKRTGRRQ
jgi:hypothetical protein